AQHRPLVRVAYNASVYAIAAAVAGAAASRFDADVVSGLVAAVAVAAFVDYWVNMVLTTLVVSVDARRPFAALIASNTRGTVGAFTLMASWALMLVVVWQRSPVLSAALVG